MSRLRVEVVSRSEEETIDFGRRLGHALRTQAVVGLTGPLGAGKTRLAGGICLGAGYAGRVRSPTFALMNCYRGVIPIRHFDLYRLEGIDAALAGEWEEEIDSPGISIVEWADRIPELLPPEAIWIDLREIGPTGRELTVVVDLPTTRIDHWRFL